MKHKQTARESIAANSLHLCALPGCSERRSKLANYCASHALRAARFGHPNALPVPPSRYVTERLEVAALVAANQNHPAVVAARSYLEGWMQTAAVDESAFKGAEQIARLVRNGVTATEVLLEVAALWSHSSTHGGLLPDDRARDVAISRAVFRLCPLPRRQTYRSSSANHNYALRPRASALAYVGRHLREVLAVTLVNIHSAVTARHERAAAAIREMQKPLEVDAAQVLAQQAASERQFQHLPGAAP